MLKQTLVVTFILISISLKAQNPMLKNVKKSGGDNAAPRIYLNDDWKPAPKANATYYLIKKYVEPVMILKSVPTYENGIQMKADETPLDKYSYEYFYLNDQLAFQVDVVALRANPDDFQYDGNGVWYHKDGTLMAKGEFDGGQLNGRYIEYDKNGNEKSVKMYRNGEEVDATALKKVYNPLVGNWVQITKDKSGISTHLRNDFKNNGSIYIYSIKYTTMFDKPVELRRSNPDEYYWKYVPKSETTGELIIYYVNGDLLGKEQVIWKGKSKFVSTITQHKSTSLVGKTYTFSRTK